MINNFNTRGYNKCECGRLFIAQPSSKVSVHTPKAICPQCREKKYYNPKITTPGFLQIKDKPEIPEVELPPTSENKGRILDRIKQMVYNKISLFLKQG